MGLGDPYLSVEAFKTRSKSASQANDAAILAALQSASQQIELRASRQFNKSEADEIRYYTYRGYRWSGPLDIDDLVSVTELATDRGDGSFDVAWETGDYELLDRNAAAMGRPFTAIRSNPRGSLAFPTGVDSVRITGIFGWPSVPAPIQQACYLLANREKGLYDAPFGQSGGGEMGALDMTGSTSPIIWGMVDPYRVVVV